MLYGIIDGDVIVVFETRGAPTLGESRVRTEAMSVKKKALLEIELRVVVTWSVVKVKELDESMLATSAWV
jgi:hypothetical protein